MGLAHIRNGQIVRHYASEDGWIELENGDRASPPQAGYVNGNDKIVPVEVVVTDQSTGSGSTISSDVTTIEADRVLIERTITDAPALRIIQPMHFLDRLTAQEQAALLGSGNAQLMALAFRLVAATSVDLDNPEVAAGMDALVSAGILTAERKAEILA